MVVTIKTKTGGFSINSPNKIEQKQSPNFNTSEKEKRDLQGLFSQKSILFSSSITGIKKLLAYQDFFFCFWSDMILNYDSDVLLGEKSQSTSCWNMCSPARALNAHISHFFIFLAFTCWMTDTLDRKRSTELLEHHSQVCEWCSIPSFMMVIRGKIF